MADAPSPVTSPPAVDGQPYDCTSTADVAGWRKLPGGPADLSTGQLTGEDFDDGPGPWRQC